MCVLVWVANERSLIIMQCFVKPARVIAHLRQQQIVLMNSPLQQMLMHLQSLQQQNEFWAAGFYCSAS